MQGAPSIFDNCCFDKIVIVSYNFPLVSDIFFIVHCQFVIVIVADYYNYKFVSDISILFIDIFVIVIITDNYNYIIVGFRNRPLGSQKKWLWHFSV